MKNKLGVAILNCLRAAFYRFGCLLGNRYVSVPVVCLMTLGSLALITGVLKVKEDHNIRQKFAPINAPSRKEQETYLDFFKTRGRPHYFMVIIQAKDRGSLFRTHPTDFMELVNNLTNYLEDELAVPDANGHLVSYKDVCGTHCKSNEIVKKTFTFLKVQRKRILKGKSFPTTQNRIDYPISTLLYKDLSIADHFYGVETIPGFSEADWRHHSTRISHVSMIALRFHADYRNSEEQQVLGALELKAFKAMRDLNSEFVEASVYGDIALDHEVLRAGLTGLPYLIAGFVLMVVFAIGSVFLKDYFQDGLKLDLRRPFVIICGVISPCLAVGSLFGAMFYIGFPFDPNYIMIPFLVLAIGVDDAFLMVHAWDNRKNEKSSSERLGQVLKDVGPSMLITSLTNSLAFAVGASTPTPIVRAFCAISAAAMALDFVYQITFFASILALSGRKQEQKDAPVKWQLPLAEKFSLQEDPLAMKLGLFLEPPPSYTSKSPRSIACTVLSDRTDLESQICPRKLVREVIKDGLSRGLEQYCSAISSLPALAAICLFLAAYWSVSIFGVLNMTPSLADSKIFLKDSSLRVVNRALKEHVWGSHFQVMIFVSTTPDFQDSEQVFKFNEMVQVFENLPNAVGPTSTNLWLRDYEHFEKSTFPDICRQNRFPRDATEDPFLETVRRDEEAFIEEDVPALSEPKCINGLSYSQFDLFFKLASYKHWEMAVHHDTNVVHRFFLTTALKNVADTAKRASLIVQLRAIAQKYSQFGVSIYDPDAFFLDQLMNIEKTTLSTILMTFGCMALVCLLLLSNITSVILASLSIASISVGVCGFMSHWGIDLDPISMCTLIMSLGLCVDFTAHVSYHYSSLAQRDALLPAQQLYITLQAVAWPTIQAGLSTVLCVSVLTAVKSYMVEAFVKTVFLVVFWGLVHGLVVLPAILTSLSRLSRYLGSQRVVK